MVQTIDLARVQQLKEAGAQIVEVLASKEYSEEHLPGAISIPLLHMSTSSVAMLDRDRPIVVYCWDFQ